MIGESGLLGLYWGARAEPLELCAEYVYESLRALQALGYERYYALGRGRRDALKRPFEITPSGVHQKLARGRSYTDIPRAPMLDLGWRLSLWSGDADLECYSVSVRCGAYSAHIGNSFVLTLPLRGIHSISASSDRASAAFDRLAAIWKPEQGVLCEGSIDWKDGIIVVGRPPHRLIRPSAQRPVD